MLAPGLFDVWNIGHALVGVSMGAFQFKRWFAYPLKIVWEIYQVFVHYGPQGLGLRDVWINSVLDTVTFALAYELALPIARLIAQTAWWKRIAPGNKYILAFLLLNSGGTFVMAWDLQPSTLPANWQLMTVVFPLFLCPAISALLIRSLISKEGFASAGLALQLKQNWPYYLASGILLPAIAAVLYLVIPVSSTALPVWVQTPFSAGVSGIATPPVLVWLVLTVQMIVLALIMAVVMFGQEFGWRSYFQPLLFPERPLLSSLVTGFYWGLWLISVTWRAYRLSGPAAMGLLAIPPITICLSIVLGWLREKTGTVWVPSLFHGAVAAIGGSLIFAPVYVKAETLSVSPLGIWVLIPLLFSGGLILFARFRQRHSTRNS